MTISQATESDLSAIAELFKACFGADAKMYPATNPVGFSVARIEDEIVAAGKLFRNSLHGTVPIMVIGVAEAHRRQGIGRKLHQTLLADKPVAPLGIDGCCFDVDSTAISFMSSLGYKLYLDCFIPVVDLQAGFPEITIPAEIKIVTLAQALARGVERAVIEKYLVTKYFHSHSWSPPTLPISDPHWSETSLGRAEGEFSAVALNGSDIVGASTGWIAGTMLEIAWYYAEGESVDEEAVLLKALMALQYQKALDKGALTAAFESDSTERTSSRIAEGLTIRQSETWKRFRFGGRQTK